MARTITFIVLASLIASSSAQNGISNDGYNYGTPDGPLSPGATSGGGSPQGMQGEKDPLQMLADAIPGGGIPGQDYPILSSAPETGFSCFDQQVPGYYADTAPEAGCQVFYICQFDGRQDGFLCPNGTIFNQQYLVCDWWYNVDCSASEQFLSLNFEIGKVPDGNQADFPGTQQEQQEAATAPDQLYSTPNEQQQQQQQQATALDQLYSTPNQQQQQQQQAMAPGQLYSTPNQQQQQQPITFPGQQYSAPDQQQQQQPITFPGQQYSAPDQQQQQQQPQEQLTAPSQLYSTPNQQQQQQQQQQQPSAPNQLYNTPNRQQQQQQQQPQQQAADPNQLYSTPNRQQQPIQPPSQYYTMPNV